MGGPGNGAPTANRHENGQTMTRDLEKDYVRDVYSRLAAYQQREHRKSTPRIWPNVLKFIKQLEIGSTVIDVGCGEAKYSSDTLLVMGVDTCPDVLVTVDPKPNLDLIIADALSLPFRENSADCILLISILHHLSTPQRRKAALEECVRCLRPGGQVLVCVWAHEQPNASFCSQGQDFLVPWHMHELALNGRLPQVKFHFTSTKEQRVVKSSIPITIPDTSSSWIDKVLQKIPSLKPAFSFLRPVAAGINLSVAPPSTPQILPRKNTILSGIQRWSPMLGKRLKSMLVSVEEQYAEEMSHKILQDALAESMAVVGEVTFYRYYHVFKKGELDGLVESVDHLAAVSTSFEHGNWCLVAEKVAQKPSTAVFRP